MTTTDSDTLFPESAICLDDSFSHAVIGHAVTPQGPRFCYSLTKMATREAINLKCSVDAARESVFKLVLEITTDHGDKAPLFIDDTVSREAPVTILGADGMRVN